MLSYFLLPNGGKKNRQEHNYSEWGIKGKKFIPTRSTNMNVYQGTSTVVTDFNLNPEGEKLPGTD